MQPRQSSRIHVLSESLANKIAAGEVVERPASVVKELVENSIDAGAERIEVNLEAGGRELIEVIDDGRGMSFEDARLCLERHATSKLRSSNDLFAIRTLGFRGEALPSIAAVSRVQILTRLRDAVSGTRVRLEGGEIAEHVEAGAPAGTKVRVSELFSNVPARRKFLRRPETELGHASETIVRIALAHPEIGFRMIHGNRTILSSPANGGLAERAAAVVGRDVAKDLYPVAAGGSPIEVTGLIASPQVTRTGNRGIYLFVNRRFVRDRSLSHAILRAYGELIDKGRSPVVILFLDAPPESVDVNVHPQKTEVRFSDGRAVYDAVASAVGRTIRASPWAAGPKRRYGLQSSKDGHGSEAGSETGRGEGRAGPGLGFADHRARVLDALGRFGAARSRVPTASLAREYEGGKDRAKSNERQEGLFAGLSVIGQLKASYIICEGEEGLVLVDQHAAHERIAYEELREARAKRQVEVQRLLVPRTLSLPAGQAEKLEEHHEVLLEIGFDISSMGGGDIAVRGLPAPIAENDVMQVLTDVLDELGSLGEQSSMERAYDALLATLACHSVVRSNEVLSLPECEALLSRLDSVEVKGSCPHGRPVAFTVSLDEIERRLSRR